MLKLPPGAIVDAPFVQPSNVYPARPTELKTLTEVFSVNKASAGNEPEVTEPPLIA